MLKAFSQFSDALSSTFLPSEDTRDNDDGYVFDERTAPSSPQRCKRQLEEREQKLRRTLAIKERNLGKDHVFVAATLQELAQVLRELRKERAAGQCELRAAKITPSDHPKARLIKEYSFATERGQTVIEMRKEQRMVEQHQRGKTELSIILLQSVVRMRAAAKRVLHLREEKLIRDAKRHLDRFENSYFTEKATAASQQGDSAEIKRLAAVAAMGPEGWTREYNKSLAAAKAKSRSLDARRRRAEEEHRRFMQAELPSRGAVTAASRRRRQEWTPKEEAAVEVLQSVARMRLARTGPVEEAKSRAVDGLLLELSRHGAPQCRRDGPVCAALRRLKLHDRAAVARCDVWALRAAGVDAITARTVVGTAARLVERERAKKKKQEKTKKTTMNEKKGAAKEKADSPPKATAPPFEKGETVQYRSTADGTFEDAKVVDVSYDDDLVPYYTIQLISDGREKSTEASRLRKIRGARHKEIMVNEGRRKKAVAAEEAKKKSRRKIEFQRGGGPPLGTSI